MATSADTALRLRASVICVRDASETEVMLVSGRRADWINPGGRIEAGESAEEAAIREAHEEAGVSGSILRPLGFVTNQVHNHKTALFVMVVSCEDADWPEKTSHGRKRYWCSVEEAVGKVKESQRCYFSLLQGHNPSQ